MPEESLSDLFEGVFKISGNKKAITFFRNGNIETELTYDALQKDIILFANFLSAYNLEKGDRVILLLEKSIITVVAGLALFKKGVIAVPLNPGFKKNELDYLLKDSKAELIMAGPGKKELIRRINPQIAILEIPTNLSYKEIKFFRSETLPFPEKKVFKNDPALIIYTSGTTGNPKGAVLTHGNLILDARNIILAWKISRDDVFCHALPLFHIHGLCFALHTALLSGAHVLMMDCFTPGAVVQILSSKKGRETCSVFMAVPAMYTKLLDFIGEQKVDFSHIRLLTSGSAPLLEKEFYRIKQVFKKEPVEREGMSETGMNFSNPLNGRKKPGSIGLPLKGVEVRIVDTETLGDVKKGKVGEIWLKSLSITKGYWEKPAETKAAFKDGWFKTGDLGRKDKEGYYYITDRIKHIIITGGENVSAKEVETVINQIEGVKESSVVGLPDDTWGEKVAALVEKLPGYDVSESYIKAVCKKELHDWKCPKEIKFTNNIPKNTMGKVLKQKAKELFHIKESGSPPENTIP
ncbi:MAG: AMP-binding protein [Deltaproteobacteria bacterium]|nr:AMP-binding protein [Deltaproteobacteria bacterium]